MSNKTRLWLYGALVVVLMVCAMGVMSQVSAQPPTPTPAPTAVELVGVVESFTSTSLVVNGQTVNISAAEIKVTLKTGLLVKVEGTLAPDGSIQAREIKAAKPNALTGEVEITGKIVSVDGNKLVIGGQTFDILKAEVKGTLSVGQTVKIHATLVNGVWVVREVERADIRTRLRRGDDDDDDINDVDDGDIDDVDDGDIDDDHEDRSGPGGGGDDGDDDHSGPGGGGGNSGPGGGH